jgi:transcriptional regulator with XRE-family HTH domain
MLDKKLMGTRIKEIRKHLRLTQKELAKKVEISDGCISDIEKGKKNPGIKVLEKLFERFNVNISYIFEGKGDFLSKTEKEKTTKPESIIKNIGDVKQNVAEMKWAIDNIPVVKFALLENYLIYLIKNQYFIKDDVERYRQEYKKKNKNKNI